MTTALLWLVAVVWAQPQVGRFDIFEASFEASGATANPYTELSAQAVLTRPDRSTWRIPLYWDGARTWKLRVSPDAPGEWAFRIESADQGLASKNGTFLCTPSKNAGGIRASTLWPGHFERQSGTRFFFLGDTAWGYFTDISETKYDRSKAEEYVRARASQGVTAIHAMLLYEEGDGNRNGPPFEDIAQERINPKYWQEVDSRIAFANRSGLTVGLALAWGDKRKKEPYAWRRFPSLAARERYARYIAARYSAFDVYFLVSGEWHAEVRTREGATDESVFREFVRIGDVLAASDPHDRMTGIHPMTRHGSVREFQAAPWMSFADYQQNYRDLHANILLSRHSMLPVVNSEYGYHLRDSNGDGIVDKDNSYNTEDMRFASWDILMGGGYLVTGFGSTYYAGRRSPGAFTVGAEKDRPWEEQLKHIRTFFDELPWWKLTPADELVSSATPREADRVERKTREEVHPPAATYWALANPGETYVLYVRGVTVPVELRLGARSRTFRIREFNPRSGTFRELGNVMVNERFSYSAPDGMDWVVVLEGRR